MPHDLPAVRVITPEDEDALMAMCLRLHSENGMMQISEQKVRENIYKCFNGEGIMIGVIGDPGGPLEASTCLSISTMHYTKDWHLEEFWNFVDKPYRRSHNAEALIKFGKDTAELMGIPFLTGIITNKQMAGKVRLYKRMLGYPAGAFFIHNAPWQAEPMEDHSALRQRLKDVAQLCNESKVTPSVAREKIGPLLREAAAAISGEDNLWGSNSARIKRVA